MAINNIIKKSTKKIKNYLDEKNYSKINHFDLSTKINFLLESNIRISDEFLYNLSEEIHIEGFKDKWTKSKYHAQITENQVFKILQKTDFENRVYKENILLPDKGTIDEINPLKSNWIKALYRRPSLLIYNTLKNNGFFNQNVDDKNINKLLIEKIKIDNLLFIVFLTSFEKDYRKKYKNNLHDMVDFYIDGKENKEKKEERILIANDMIKHLIKNDKLIKQYASQFDIEYDTYEFNSEFMTNTINKIKLETKINKTNTSKDKQKLL